MENYYSQTFLHVFKNEQENHSKTHIQQCNILLKIAEEN